VCEEKKKCENQSCRHQDQWRRRGRRCSSFHFSLEKRFPCSPWRRQIKQMFHCSPWRWPHCSTYPHCAPWRIHAKASLSWRTAGLQQTAGEDPHWNRVTVWAVEEAAERSCYGLTTTSPSSCPLCHLGLGEGSRGVGCEEVKLSLGKRGGGDVFWFLPVFLFYHPTHLLTGNKLNYSSPIRVCFACDSNWQVTSLSLSWPLSFSIFFSPLVLFRRGAERTGGWGSGSCQGHPTTSTKSP